MKDKNKTTAGILALFFGGLGVHRFYLNQVGLGLLYIFLSIFTAGIFAFFASIIDGIKLLQMSDLDFAEKYCQKAQAEQLNNKNKSDNLVRLKQLNDLKKEGALTHDEYQTEKMKIIG